MADGSMLRNYMHVPRVVHVCTFLVHVCTFFHHSVQVYAIPTNV